MLNDLLTPASSGKLQNVICDIQGGLRTAVFGVPFSQKSRIISLINGKVIFIVKSVTEAKNYVEEISALTDKKVVFLPSKDDVLLYKQAYDKQSLYNRITAVYDILNGAEITGTTFEALLQLFPRKVDSFTIENGAEYDVYNVINKLISLGYKRVDYCESKASFSLRGDILEVFPINSNDVYRVDFFCYTV